jgi:hypothetical protein
MEFATEVKKGLIEGVKGVPLAIHSKETKPCGQICDESFFISQHECAEMEK